MCATVCIIHKMCMSYITVMKKRRERALVERGEFIPRWSIAKLYILFYYIESHRIACTYLLQMVNYSALMFTCGGSGQTSEAEVLPGGGN